MDTLLPEQTQKQPLHLDKTKQLEIQRVSHHHKVHLRDSRISGQQLGHSVQLAVHLIEGQA